MGPYITSKWKHRPLPRVPMRRGGVMLALLHVSVLEGKRRSVKLL
jgi:hypothetical protein